jgi:hypothetical protein
MPVNKAISYQIPLADDGKFATNCTFFDFGKTWRLQHGSWDQGMEFTSQVFPQTLKIKQWDSHLVRVIYVAETPRPKCGFIRGVGLKYFG